MIAFVHHPPGPEALPRLRRVLAWVRSHGVEAAVVAADPADCEALAGVASIAAEAGGATSSLARVASCAPPVADRDLAGALCGSLGALSDGAVVIVDAQAPLGFDLRGLITEHHQSPAVITIALVPPERATPGAPRADVDRSGRVLGLLSPIAAEWDQPAVDGCLVVERAVFERFATEPRPFDVWDQLVMRVLGRGGLVGGYLVSPTTGATG
ncbi:MAG: hypothetical protein U1F36_21425 [Planctomycetota bacterium]